MNLAGHSKAKSETVSLVFRYIFSMLDKTCLAKSSSFKSKLMCMCCYDFRSYEDLHCETYIDMVGSSIVTIPWGRHRDLFFDKGAYKVYANVSGMTRACIFSTHSLNEVLWTHKLRPPPLVGAHGLSKVSTSFSAWSGSEYSLIACFQDQDLSSKPV